MEAMNPTDKLNVLNRIQEALNINRNDISALLELAALQEKANLKRKVLNRVLTLDPVNKTAREMLLEMDRAEMGGDQSLPTPGSVPAIQQANPPAGTSLEQQEEKPFVSRYSLIPQILVYSFLAFSILLMFMAWGEWEVFVSFTQLFLLLLIPVWFVSAVVKVNSSGISTSRLFGIYRRELEWGEIDRIKPAVMGVGMKLVAKDGRSMTISSQMSGYRSIVEILWSIRSDLFDMNGTKTFQKGFFAKYGPFFILIPATPLALGALLTPPFIPGLLVVIAVFYIWRYTLNGVHSVRVEENRLSARSFRKKYELTAQNVKEISVVTRYNRRGVATNFVQIELLDQPTLMFTGFREGNEIMYGFLMHWWGAYQST